jgi:hypothetical protein
VVADGWLPLPVTSSKGALEGFRDVAWASDTQLMVLAASSDTSFVSSYLMDADGSQVEAYGPTYEVDAASLATVALHVGGPAALMLTGSGRVYRCDDPSRWPGLGDDTFTAVAYAG